jgi:hypothetical protein
MIRIHLKGRLFPVVYRHIDWNVGPEGHLIIYSEDNHKAIAVYAPGVWRWFKSKVL